MRYRENVRSRHSLSGRLRTQSRESSANSTPVQALGSAEGFCVSGASFALIEMSHLPGARPGPRPLDDQIEPLLSLFGPDHIHAVGKALSDHRGHQVGHNSRSVHARFGNQGVKGGQ